MFSVQTKSLQGVGQRQIMIISWENVINLWEHELPLCLTITTKGVLTICNLYHAEHI